jgi:hypothetical protein
MTFTYMIYYVFRLFLAALHFALKTQHELRLSLWMEHDNTGFHIQRVEKEKVLLKKWKLVKLMVSFFLSHLI